MKIYDLTHDLSNNMSVYPGDPDVKIEQITDIENKGFLMHRLKAGTHTGTHIDAPGHILMGGKMLDRYPVIHFIGSALIIKAKFNKDGFIEVELPDIAFDHLIINSGWYKKWGSETYYYDFPVLSKASAKKIAGLPLKTIGFDTPSADDINSNDYPVHKILLEKEILIIENMKLDDELNGELVDLFVLPLKIKSVEASPVRIAAIKK